MTSFRPAEHVRKRADFELIYKTGTKRSGRLMTMFTREREEGVARLGIAATRKMGAAVARNRAKRVVKDILEFGRVKYGTLGVQIVDRPGILQIARARQQLARETGAEPPQQGILVQSVEAGSSAAAVGVNQLDVLTKVDSVVLNLPIDLTKALMDKRPGDKVRLTFWSKGQTKTVEVTLKEPAQNI